MKKHLIIIGMSLLSFIAVFSSCEKNHAPMIIDVSFSPLSGKGGTIFTFTVQAVDQDRDPITYLWTCDYGNFLEGSTSVQAKWQAPVLMEDQLYSINVSVSDGAELITETTQIQVGKTETESFDCIDPDGRSYKTIQIGDQTWMIENLAYLPSVSPSSSGSDTSPYYYVWGYEESSVSGAKATSNYETYGVLYNWEAAKGACPDGWHLPTDADWTILTDWLTNNGYGFGGSGSDIGKSMASTPGWTFYSIAGTVGNDQGSNNSSGFNALPGGSRHYYGGFDNLGNYALFWSSTENGSSHAWSRLLYYHRDGVYRLDGDRRFGFSVRCLKN